MIDHDEDRDPPMTRKDAIITVLMYVASGALMTWLLYLLLTRK